MVEMVAYQILQNERNILNVVNFLVIHETIYFDKVTRGIIGERSSQDNGNSTKNDWIQRLDETSANEVVRSVTHSVRISLSKLTFYT